MIAVIHSAIALWALVVIVLAAAAGAALVWRARKRAGAAQPTASVAPLVRRFEEEQLARMEADGVPLWKPDPERLRRMTTVRD